MIVTDANNKKKLILYFDLYFHGLRVDILVSNNDVPYCLSSFPTTNLSKMQIFYLSVSEHVRLRFQHVWRGREDGLYSLLVQYYCTATARIMQSGVGIFKKKNQKQPLYLVVGTSCARGNCVDEKFGRKYVMCQGDIL